MRVFHFLLLTFLFPFCFCGHQPSPTTDQAQKAVPTVLVTQSIKTDNRSTLLATAQRWLGRPYVANVLNENGTNERLVIDTMRLDCWTFTEYCLAQALVADQGDFAEQVQQLRYRNGQVNGFGSRLHYFTEWASLTTQNNYLTDITSSLGGMRDKRMINYITAHPKAYPLCASVECMAEIAKYESIISSLNNRYFIPKNAVKDIENQIKDGDIIGITSAIPGLDFAHQGIAIEQRGRVHLIHASSDLGKVVISKEPLSAYLQHNKKQSGITVLRLHQ
jgi:Protein of unknown function (DUF1460)